MKSGPPEVLLSARDPATAHAVCVLLQHAQTDARLRFSVLAQSPALEILQRAELAVRLIPFPSRADTDQLVTAARTVLEQLGPEMILSGVSGPDCGVDEALLAAGCERGIPCYALQSFWGDVNDTLGSVAETFFVLDQQAARLTRQRHPVRTVPVGSLKHANYAAFDIAGIRQRQRAKLELKPEQPLIGFFGQPLGQLPGYLETLQHLAPSLAAIPCSARVLYRPHPKETITERDRSLTILRQSGLKVLLDSEARVEHTLCACDLVTSAFSSCGLDALYLNALSPHPLNSVLYLLFNPELRSWYQHYTRLEELPPVTAGMALSCTKPDELASTLQHALQPETRQQCWEQSRQLSPPQQAAQKIIETLMADYSACKR